MAGCAICSANPKITELQDYEKFCGASPTDKVRSLEILSPDQRVSPMEFAKQFRHAKGTILLDVRPLSEFEICHLPEAKSCFPHTNFSINLYCFQIYHGMN